MLWKRAILQGKTFDWEGALAAEPASDAARAATRFILQIASQTSEFYLGGNDTPLLLQFLSAPSDPAGAAARDVDLMVTVLAPLEGEGVEYLHTARGEAALALCASFLDGFPHAPVLVQKADGGFDYVLCAMEGAAWTRGPVTLQRLAELALRSSVEEQRLAFFMPADRAPRADGSPAAATTTRPPTSFERFPERPSRFLD